MRTTIKVLNITKQGPNQLIVEYRAKTEKPLIELINDAAAKLGISAQEAKARWLDGDDLFLCPVVALREDGFTVYATQGEIENAFLVEGVDK